MAWNDIDKVKEGGGIFKKLKNGESFEGVFVGEPITYYKIFGDNTEYPQKVAGSSFKIKIVVAIKEEGAWKGVLFEQGVKFAKSLRAFVSECGQNQVYKVMREGSGKDDTEYHIFPKESLTQKQIDEILSSITIPSLVGEKAPSIERNESLSKQANASVQSGKFDEINPPPMTDDDCPF